MVNQPRAVEPRYSCIVPVDRLTGNFDEELITFGGSADEAKQQAEERLIDHYGCDQETVTQLMQQAQIEPLAQWCSPNPSLNPHN
jgi:hypothetical protein